MSSARSWCRRYLHLSAILAGQSTKFSKSRAGDASGTHRASVSTMLGRQAGRNLPNWRHSAMIRRSLWSVLVLVAAASMFAEPTAPIDRQALVSRHNPVLRELEMDAPL